MKENYQFKIYVNEKWITGDTCIESIYNPIDQLNVKKFLFKKRTAFVEKLRQEGFLITQANDEIDEDTICLVMDENAICNVDIPLSVWKKKFDQKIFENAGKHFHYPRSMSLEEYFEHPFFKAVFKNEFINGGIDKFLIENQKQVDIIQACYQEYKNIPDKKEKFDYCIAQQYLETPSDYTTYLRVLVGGSGETMGASLKYSKKTKEPKRNAGFFEQLFLNPDSKYFIDAEKVFHYYSNGGNISFCQPRYCSEKEEILYEHGFDPDHLKLPEEVLDVCKNIMINCQREIGVLCGFDFMLNQEDGKWYYLENQAFPAIEEWATVKHIKIPGSHDIEGYKKYLELELQTRYEALMLLINQRKKQKNKEKCFLLKKESI